MTMTNEQYSLFDSEYTDVKIGTRVRLFLHYWDADGNYLSTEEGLDSSYYKHEEDIEWPPEKFEKDKPKDEPEPNGDGEPDDSGEDPGTGGGDGGDDGGEIGVVVTEDP